MVPEHLSAAHRAHLEWTPKRLSHWGNSIGVAAGALVTRLLATRKHSEHAYRACLGLLAIDQTFYQATPGGCLCRGVGAGHHQQHPCTRPW